MPENVVIYTRVSTAKQTDNYSLQAQIQECTQMAKTQNYNVVEVIQEVGSAFKIGKQVNLQKLIANLASNNSKGVTKILVHSYDRFARNLRQAIDNIDLLLTKKIIVESVTDNVNYLSPYGRHQLNMTFSSSEFQSAVLGSKISMGMNFKKGITNNNNDINTAMDVDTDAEVPVINNLVKNSAPYGYDRVRGALIPNSFEQSSIKFIICSRNSICSSTELSDIIYQIVPSTNFSPIEFYENDTKIENMRPFELTYEEIANLLNEYGVKKRNQDWTPQTVSYIYNKYKHHAPDLNDNYVALRTANTESVENDKDENDAEVKQRPAKKRRLH
jgi:hypothetical protein